MNTGLIYTNDNCIGCNKCVRICTAVGASISSTVSGRSSISIDTSRCINCGACFEACDRGARSYHDDTDQFFSDLKKGEEISLLVAPAFAARFSTTYSQILGGLQQLGVKRIISVSFGADICTWAYVSTIEKEGYINRISTTCPVSTAFVEHCQPSLLPYLMPIKSPMMCAATYCREQLGMTEKFAFLGPCIAKKTEMNRFPDMIHYNVTFDHLIKHIDELDLTAPPVVPELPSGLGNFYPAPGGLADNIHWFLGDDVPIRVISGKRYLFRWMRNSTGIFSSDGDRSKNKYALIDALNCLEGCIEGTAAKSSLQTDLHNDTLLALNTIRQNSKQSAKDSPWNPALSPEERWENLKKQFSHLNLSSYSATFRDESAGFKIKTPSEKEKGEIFQSMYKLTDAEQMINCSACGYETCEKMAVAIYNGFNTKDNCIYYKREEAIHLERMSFFDKLTNVMNRNALENTLEKGFPLGNPLSILVADVNGLKFINDTKGHNAGDHLIRNCAQILAIIYGEKQVFRTGGDEFLVITQNFSASELNLSIENIRKEMNESAVSMSLGYIYVEHYEGNYDELVKKADVLMYEDKELYYKRTGKPRRT